MTFRKTARTSTQRIIRLGYGFAVSSTPPLKYQEEFRRLEREAREQGQGLWAERT